MAFVTPSYEPYRIESLSPSLSLSVCVPVILPGEDEPSPPGEEHARLVDVEVEGRKTHMHHHRFIAAELVMFNTCQNIIKAYVLYEYFRATFWHLSCFKLFTSPWGEMYFE